MSTTERRKHPRLQLDLPLRLTVGERTVDTLICDISTSGIRFRTPEPLPMMSRVQIGLELPASGSSGPVAMNGVVVRSDLRPDDAGNPEPEGGPYETAIFFDDLPPQAQTQLTRFLENRVN